MNHNIQTYVLTSPVGREGSVKVTKYAGIL